jgi:hypothetical protein
MHKYVLQTLMLVDRLSPRHCKKENPRKSQLRSTMIMPAKQRQTVRCMHHILI